MTPKLYFVWHLSDDATVLFRPNNLPKQAHLTKKAASEEAKRLALTIWPNTFAVMEARITSAFKSKEPEELLSFEIDAELPSKEALQKMEAENADDIPF